MGSLVGCDILTAIEALVDKFVGGTDGTAPSMMKAYINRDDLDFGMVADLPPLQKWDLQENLRGELEYPTQ